MTKLTKPKTRLRGVEVAVITTPEIKPSDFGAGVTLIKFRVIDSGEILVWWASGDRRNDFARGQRLVIGYTVKRPPTLNEYTGTHETKVTYVRVEKS